MDFDNLEAFFVRIEADTRGFDAKLDAADTKREITEGRVEETVGGAMAALDEVQAEAEMRFEDIKARAQMSRQLITSTVRQLYSMLDRLTGIGENAFVSLFSGMFSIVSSLIVTAIQAAMVYASIPGGQIISGVLLAMAGANAVFAGQLLVQQFTSHEDIRRLGYMIRGEMP